MHKKLPHKTLRVHSARYTQCIHVSSRKLKLPKDMHSYLKVQKTKQHQQQQQKKRKKKEERTNQKKVLTVKTRTAPGAKACSNTCPSHATPQQVSTWRPQAATDLHHVATSVSVGSLYIYIYPLGRGVQTSTWRQSA